MHSPHLNADGTPRYTNRLAAETSPYLTQHAHNPVEWYAWGNEALERARRENKPIHLSVGYHACHWCHVMADESFEDEATARVLNDNFVNIKVDREERPDIDQIYMSALHHLGEHGGWPLTKTASPARRARTSCSTSTIRSTGGRGEPRRSPKPSAPTSRSCCRSATPPATGAMSWRMRASRTRRSPRR